MLSELQLNLVDMLKWFHEMCESNNLRYYAIGGTLLGAVRHNGFIPWDDDIDVCMPRDDYNHLIIIMRNACGQTKYVLETPLQNKDYVYQYCKIYDSTTVMIERTRYNLKRGTYIDIFPLDGIGNTLEESLKNYKKIDRKNKYILTKVCAINKNRNFYKNFAIIVSRCIPFPRWRKTLKKLDNFCQSKKFVDYEYVVNPYGNWHEKEIFKREWFGDPKLYHFEDININGPQDAHSLLTAVYGDYMKLPPLEKQVTHHSYSYLNLHESF